MQPWCIVLVCSWRRLLADRHLLPFPWNHSPHRRWCPSASHHSFSFLSLGRLCQWSPRTCPVSLLRVESARRKATAFAVGQVRPSGHPTPAVRVLSPTAAFGPWDEQGWERGGGGGAACGVLQRLPLGAPGQGSGESLAAKGLGRGSRKSGDGGAAKS